MSFSFSQKVGMSPQIWILSRSSFTSNQKKAVEFNPDQNQKSSALTLWQVLFHLLCLFNFLWTQTYLAHGFSIASIIAASCLVKVVLLKLEEREFYKWWKINFKICYKFYFEMMCRWWFYEVKEYWQQMIRNVKERAEARKGF